MNKINYVDIKDGKMFYDEKLNHYVQKHKCPYGYRDLNNDECYSGNGVNRCKYFVKYDWEKHYGLVACTHPINNVEQLEFEF